jgi:tetratricopeptide (TPR) repeat protein
MSSVAQTIAQCNSLIEEGTYAFTQKDYAKSLEYAIEAKNMAEGKGWYKQLFTSTNLIGENYYRGLNYGEALNYFTEGYTMAFKQLESNSKIIALKNIAKIYVKENSLVQANKQLLQALDIAQKNDLQIYYGELYTALGDVDNLLGNYGQAREYILKAISLTKEIPQQQLQAQTILAENDLLQGKASQARTLAQGLISKASEIKDRASEILLLTIIAESYQDELQYSEAANTALKALALQPDPEQKAKVFEILSKVYYNAGNYDAAFQYKDSVIVNNNSLANIKNTDILKSSMLTFENHQYKEQIADKNLEMAAERKIMYATLLALIIGVVIYVTGLKKKKSSVDGECQKLANELAKEKNNNLLLGKRLQEQETIAVLEQERLKNDLEFTRKKILSQALYISDKDNQVEEVLMSIEQRPAISKDKTITKEIMALRGHLKAESEWKNFIVHFEEVNQEILQRLKKQHPALTQNDMRFLAYIYMNLSIKEIASILGITPESCRKRKERIVLKLEIPEDSNLYDYISGN